MRIIKLSMVAALIAVVLFAGLSGGQQSLLAYEGETQTQTYVVMAGSSGGNVGVEMFAPSALQVHQGDTVRWLLGGFHNIHFEDANIPLLLPLEQDGKSILQINPVVAMGNVQSGGNYTGGDANSGLPLGGPPSSNFDLKIDAPPGTYHYFCDIHAGMTGMIEVTDSSVSLASPVDSLSAGFKQLFDAQSAGSQAEQAAKAAPVAATDTGVTITIGARAGQASIIGFFPNYAEIKVGQSVTWAVPADAMPGPFGIGSVPLPAQDQLFGIIPAQAGPPTIVIPDVGTNGNLASGSSVKLGDSWYTGILDPAESYTLTFTEPGVYRFSDGGPGQIGVIVVEAAT